MTPSDLWLTGPLEILTSLPAAEPRAPVQLASLVTRGHTDDASPCASSNEPKAIAFLKPPSLWLAAPFSTGLCLAPPGLCQYPILARGCQSISHLTRDGTRGPVAEPGFRQQGQEIGSGRHFLLRRGAPCCTWPGLD